MLTRRGFLSLTGVGLLAATAPRAIALETQTLGGSAFGSYWRLTGPGGIDGEYIAALMDANVAIVDALFSPYSDQSAISRFNFAPDTDWQPLAQGARPVVAAALDIASQSDGAFDPTLGPLVARYGFGPLASAEPGHFSQIELSENGLRKASAGLSLDLCGIAKGHALDRAVQALELTKIDDCLIDFGGELYGRGRHPDGRPWQVAVENPLTGGLEHLVALDGLAVATSGLLAQGYVKGGRVFSHVIDPATREPVLGETLSVSVLAREGMTADGWATALLARPGEAAIAMAEARGLAALFLLRDGAGVKTVTTGNFTDHLLA